MITLNKPKSKHKFMMSMILYYFIINFALSILFAFVYQYVDNKHGDSKLKGLASPKDRSFVDYLYFSIIINSTLGLGEVSPRTGTNGNEQKSSYMRLCVAVHIFSVLWINDILDTYENIKLS